jgi:hypothetical protein
MWFENGFGTRYDGFQHRFDVDTGGGSRMEAMRIMPGGNVGIGTTSPSARLDLGSGTANTVHAILGRGVTDSGFQLAVAMGSSGGSPDTEQLRLGLLYSGSGWNGDIRFLRGAGATDGTLAFDAGGAERVRIAAATDILAITTSNYSASVEGGIRLKTTGNEIAGRMMIRISGGGVPRVAFDGPTAVGAIGESFCIDWATLNVGIGKTSAAYRLDVAGDVNISSGSVYRINGVALSTGGVVVLQAGIPASSGDGLPRPTINFVSGTSSNPSAALDAANNRYNVTFNFTSDRRIKRSITDLEGGLSVIDRLRPVAFEYTGVCGYPEGKRSVAIIAQELQEVLPDAVYTAPYRLHPDDEAETDILCYDPMHILYHLLLAVKQLKQELSMRN